MKSDAREIIKKASQEVRNTSFMFTFGLILISLIIAPMIIDGLFSDLFFQVCFYILIVFTMYTIKSNRKILFAAIALAVPLFLCDLWSIYSNSLKVATIMQFLLTAYLIFAMVFIITEVMKESVINTNLIFGAIMVYFLAGIVWGKFYWLVHVFYPNSFKGLELNDLQIFGVHKILSTQFDLMYYSFTTMATLGLGDIVPVHRLARSLTILQAVFGQLFIAITIAKMVTVWKTNP